LFSIQFTCASVGEKNYFDEFLSVWGLWCNR